MDQSAIPAIRKRHMIRPYAQLRAVIDRIIPPDHFPGAWDAGAGAYILGQLAASYMNRRRPSKMGFARSTPRRDWRSPRVCSPGGGGADLLLAAIERGRSTGEVVIRAYCVFTLLVKLTARATIAIRAMAETTTSGLAMIGYQHACPSTKPHEPRN